MENSYVVAHDRRLPRDGSADGCAVLRTDGHGAGDRFSWSGGEKADLLSVEKYRDGRRAGFYVLQCGPYSRKRALESQRRKRDEAGRAISASGHLPGLRRFTAFRGGAKTEDPRDLAGRSVPNDAWRAGELGPFGPGVDAGLDAAHGGKHRGFVS